MQRVLEQIEAHYQEKEFRGQGITVAVLDTGMGKHPDLSSRVLCFKDFVNNRKMVYDDNGHGTHVSGILCGNGALSGGRYRGIAPEAELVVCKVLDKNGDGIAGNMLDALEWVITNRVRYHIRVVNISVGIGDISQISKEQALQKIVNELWDLGVTVVCAAGNKGPGNGSISSLCSNHKVITVGCHDGKYCLDNPHRCATYSGRGVALSPTRKPDIVAPGTDIMSCNLFLKKNLGAINHAYVKKSGTSMATPIVAGTAALTFSKFPTMSNEEFKQKLTYTATDLGEPWNLQGWGMVNVKKILES